MIKEVKDTVPWTYVISCMLNGKDMIIHLIAGLIKKGVERNSVKYNSIVQK